MHKKLSYPNIYSLRSSAGSGKTFSLACWYLRILFKNSSRFQDIEGYKNILAITFTKKASKEMKQRILDFLRAVALMDTEILKSIIEFEELSNAKTPDFMERAARVHTDILRNFESFNVRTIDSFFTYLLKTLSLKMGINPGFTIEEDSERYVRSAFRDYIEEIVEKKPAEDIDLIENVITELLFYHNLDYFPEKSITDMLISVLMRYESIYGAEFESPDYIPAAFSGFIRNIREKTILLADEILSRGLSPKANFLKLIEKLKSLDPDSAKWKDFKESISSNLVRDEPDGYKKSKVAPTNMAQMLWKEILDNIRNALEYKSMTYYSKIIKLYGRIKSHIEKQKNEKGIIFIDEINKRLRDILAQEANLIFADTGLEHFLIDEFQDTNILQFNNLKPLIDEALSGEGSLFFVGDRKQSIYRFRGSDSSIFKKAESMFTQSISSRTLDKNYRSLLNIVEFNNRVFDSGNISRWAEDAFTDAMGKGCTGKVLSKLRDKMRDDFSNSSQTASREQETEKGYVFLQALPGDISTPYSHVTELLTDDLLKRFNHKDIAILTFKNQESRDLSQTLTNSGIPNISDNALDIRENETVKAVISLINYILNQGSDACLFEFLLSAVFSRWASSRQLFQNSNIMDLLEKRKSEKFADYICKNYPVIKTELITPLCDDLRLKSFYAFCRNLCAKLNVLGMFPEDAIFIYKLFEFVQNRSEKAESSSELIMEEINSEERNKDLEIEASEDIDSVRILTIHKSKGLQFPAVIIPKIALNNWKIFNAYESAVLDNDKIHLYKIDKSEALKSDRLLDLFADEIILNLSDSINMLYVALTRPSRELYMFFSENIRENTGFPCKSYLSLFNQWPEVEEALSAGKHYSIGSKIQSSPCEQEDKQLTLDNLNADKDWEELLKKRGADISVLNGLKNFNEYVSRKLALSFLRSCPVIEENNLGSEIQNFLKRERIDEPGTKNMAEEIIRSIMLDERLKSLHFDKKTVKNFAVADKNGTAIFIDRIIILSDSIHALHYTDVPGDLSSDTVDFKKAVDLLRLIYPDRIIKAFFASTADSYVREVN